LLISVSKYLTAFAIAFLFSLELQSQHLKDTLRLPEFELKAGYVRDNMGFKRVKLDSNLMTPLRSADLSVLISNHSTIFIKSYGNNNLASPSFRGTAAHHTQVEWNGISLNSPMLGQTDFSQIPVSQFDRVEILYGAAGIPNTSGAFGGVVNLVTSPVWNNSLDISFSQLAGSFYNTVSNLGVVTGNEKVQSHTRINYTAVENDFIFTNDEGDRVRQYNASGTQWGMSEEVFFRINDESLITGKIWFSNSVRNLPPVVSNYGTDKKEKLTSQAIRGILEYKLARSMWNLMARSGLIDDYMIYLNDSLGLNSHHHYYSSVNRVRFSWNRIRNVKIRPGVDFNHDWVISTSYPQQITRNTLGFFLETLYEPHKKLDLSLILKEDLIDGKITPFVLTIGAEYQPFNRAPLALNLNLSRNYRYPTLNDLYWEVYGNPDLHPETDYLAELGMKYQWISKNKGFTIEAGITGYYSWIFDYIEWTTVSAGIYSPENITEVFSRGVEAGAKFKGQLGELMVSLDNNYHYCLSTYQKTYLANDNRLGKQLIYVPVHTLNSTVSADLYGFFLQYNFYWNSGRFTDHASQNYIPGYNLSNVFFGRKFNMRNILLSLQLQINNLFNLDYQAVTNYAMPGRNFAITLLFNFSQTR